MIVKHFIFPLVVTLALVLPVMALSGCNKKKQGKCKDEQCDKSLLIIGNRTAEDVDFNKGESGTGVTYYMKVKPGGSVTIECSAVDVSYSNFCEVKKKNRPIQGVNTRSMYFSVDMDRCEKHVTFVKDAAGSLQLEEEE